MLSMDLFAADEILNGDDYYLYYYGYDHLGNEVNESVSFDDFLNETDGNGMECGMECGMWNEIQDMWNVEW